MSDLFFDARQVPDDFVARVFATMAATPQHTYQVLTKRPERYAHVLDGPRGCALPQPRAAAWPAAQPRPCQHRLGHRRRRERPRPPPARPRLGPPDP